MTVLDPLGGIVVSGMLVKSSVGLLGSSMKELMDKGISQDELMSIESAIAKVQVCYNEVHHLRERTHVV
jgi:divalent metal cation (Fe/Co/Zn/Cd) transporter